MEPLFTFLLAPLEQVFFVKALIGGILVAVVCGATGSLVVLKRMSFLGDALSHAMIAGVAGGYLFMKLAFGIEAHAPAMLVGSLIAAILTVALIGFVSGTSRIKEDTAIGIMYTGVFAAGVVLVSVFRNHIHIDLMHFIMGDVLSVAEADIKVAGIVTALVLTTLLLFFRQFQATAFDPVMAAAIGIPVMVFDYLLTTCVSLVVVSAVSMVGVILVVGLLITPAATAYLLSDRLDRMMFLAALFGATGVTGGLYLSYWLDSSGGGAIMLFATFQFLVVLIFAPRYGILARKLRLARMVPQSILEDLLVAVLKSKRPELAATSLQSLTPTRKLLDRALQRLLEEGKLAQTATGFSLTPEGRTAALAVQRSHRIWEAYLEKAGTPEEAIHPTAHRLEHVNDPDGIESLDDLLCHPTHDPHGQEIPQDPELLVPGRIFAASLLRNNQSAVVCRLLPGIRPEGISEGSRLVMHHRSASGEIWHMKNERGEPVRLDHHTADRVLVRLVSPENPEGIRMRPEAV